MAGVEELDRQNYYQHLIPAEVLLDVFSFANAIELSKYKKIHKYFGKMIDCYSKSLPIMLIQQLDIIMDREKYLDKIVMQQNAYRVLEFGTFPELLSFIRLHPMPIEKLNLWNTIWVSKSMLQIANIVQIGQVKICHNSQSRYYKTSAYGQLIMLGTFRQTRQLNCQLLMEDHIHFIKTLDKNRRRNDRGVPPALNFFPPNNFECFSIQLRADHDALFSAKELIDYVLENAMAGRPLIVEEYAFDEPFASVVCRIFQEIKKNYNRAAIKPFTILFKRVIPRPAPEPKIVQFPNGMKFMAGLLRYDEAEKMHFLVGSTEKVLMPDGIDAQLMDKVSLAEEATGLEEDQDEDEHLECIIQYNKMGGKDGFYNIDTGYTGPSTSSGIY